MQKYTLHSLRMRMICFVLAAALVFTMLFVRLAVLQLVDGQKLQARAAEQWLRDLPVTPERGLITDRNGVLLAGNRAVYSVYVRPNAVEDKARVTAFLAEVLELDSAWLSERLGGKNVSEITIARQVEKENADKIILEGLKGVYLSIDNERVYPLSDSLAQVLGYVSVDNSGQGGLELYYDEYLRGVEGKVLSQSDLLGRELDGAERLYLAPVSGMTLELTIDSVIQRIAENAMDHAMKVHSPVAARAMVMDVQTGEILAMANRPSLDLNNLPRDDLALLNSLSRNSLAVDIFEPGSTFKIFTVAANLEEYSRGNKNAFSTSHIFTNASRLRVVDGQIIKCWDKHSNGKHFNQNIQKALNNSCNPIFVDIALALGRETFYDYIEKFGFGKPTGLDFPGEQGGLLLPESTVKNCDLARIGFGQTIALTPLQLLAGTAAVVNGGRYYSPHLVRSIYSADGLTAKRVYPAQKTRVISEDTSAKMRELLENVVTEGSGKNAYIQGYRVGGKTGTAQKYENGRIAQGKYVSSFVGFFPANNPQYAALVIVDEPVGQHYGSMVAAPFCRQIFEQIITYKNIPMPV